MRTDPGWSRILSHQLECRGSVLSRCLDVPHMRLESRRTAAELTALLGECDTIARSEDFDIYTLK
jgi:hypothetical protein